MNTYSIALFLHIAGTLGFFVSLGLEWAGLWQLGSSTTAELVRAWMRIIRNTRGLGMASMLTILVSGFYMTATVWGGAGWIIVTLAALVLGVVLTLALSGPRMAAIGRALAMEKGPVSRAFQNLANHPLLWISLQSRVAIGLGIIFLKIVKPDLSGSLFVIAVAIAAGLASVLPLVHRERVQEKLAE